MVKKQGNTINLVREISQKNEAEIYSSIVTLCADCLDKDTEKRSLYPADLEVSNGEVRRVLVFLSKPYMKVQKVDFYFSQAGDLELRNLEAFDFNENSYRLNAVKRHGVRGEGENAVLIFEVDVKVFKLRHPNGLR